MNVLLVEDETRVSDFVQRGLSAEGWVVRAVPDAECALEVVLDEPFDAIVLDLMLPGMSGLDLCRQLRARNVRTPVLMLTAMDKVDDRVSGLRTGADDYLTKPFAFDELIARLEALVRRARRFAEDGESHVLRNGELSFDTVSLEVMSAGERIELSAKERDILKLLLTSPGRVHSRERILNTVWGAGADPLTNVVDVYISRLRKKLGSAAKSIETVHGAGYRLSARGQAR